MTTSKKLYLRNPLVDPCHFEELGAYVTPNPVFPGPNAACPCCGIIGGELRAMPGVFEGLVVCDACDHPYGKVSVATGQPHMVPKLAVPGETLPPWVYEHIGYDDGGTVNTWEKVRYITALWSEGMKKAWDKLHKYSSRAAVARSEGGMAGHLTREGRKIAAMGVEIEELSRPKRKGGTPKDPPGAPDLTFPVAPPGDAAPPATKKTPTAKGSAAAKKAWETIRAKKAAKLAAEQGAN